MVAHHDCGLTPAEYWALREDEGFGEVSHAQERTRAPYGPEV